MTPGWSSPLLVFAMDHRNSFRHLLGLSDSGAGSAGRTDGSPDQASGRRIKSAVFAGFAAALDQLEDRSGTTVLLDEEYGGHLVADARSIGAKVCLPLERSGQAELQWEYGDDPADTAAVVDHVDPDLVKVLLRYNPEGDDTVNRRQADRLAVMSQWCLDRDLPLMVEVLIPPTPQQRAELGDDMARWDVYVRPRLMVEVVRRLRAAGADPSIWKVEGLDAEADAQAVVAEARADGRDGLDGQDAVSCIVLGRGADLERVEDWLRVGAATPGFVGFAVGRSLWNGPALGLWRGELSEDEVRDQVAANYLRLCRAWRLAAPELPEVPAATS